MSTIISNPPVYQEVSGELPLTEFDKGVPSPLTKAKLFVLRRLRSWRFSLIFSTFFIFFLLIAAIHPSLLVSGDPLEANARLAFQPPQLDHILGTDENGRDVLTRLVHGARQSVIMGLGATAISVSLGILIGLAAGLGPRFLDQALMRVVDVLLAFPELLLALVIITFWGQGLMNAMVAVGMANVPRYARLVRAQTQVVRSSLYIESAITLGMHPLTLIWRHILPNAVKPILLLATIGIGMKIAAGASLSFLGFGATPPAPEWGSMLATGRNFLANAWWLTALPGIAITFTVISITIFGRELTRISEGKSS